MLGDLTGKHAIVTGAGSGIGTGIASVMTSQGASVAIADLNEEASHKTSHQIEGDTMPLGMDVTNVQSVQRAIDQVISEWGKIDILVNNAGTASGGPFEDNSDEAWFLDLELKLFGAIRCIREALPFMRQGKWGRVINVTNLGGKAPGAGSTPTSVSRAGGIALTKALSKELASDNILVNTVCIGRIKAAQGQKAYEIARTQSPGLTLDEYYGKQAEMLNVPLGRVGEASEAADVITFLASERASYVTGVAVNIDGGASPVV